MSEKDISKEVPLEADNPFALRVNLGEHVSDTEVQKALATGEIGFLHSFTTGSTVDGPGVRLVAWTSGCQFRCLYCHNPDTWKMRNGIPVTLAKATEELSKYRSGLKIMGGRIYTEWRRTTHAGQVCSQIIFCCKKNGNTYRS